MLLREKTVIVVTVIVASLMLVLYSSAQAIVANNVAQLEQDQTNNSLERVLKILSNDLSNLDTIVQDWACWDDTYDYAKDSNPAYVRSNLVDETFANLRLNLLVITNSSGSTVFAKAFDLQSETEVPIPQDLVDHLSPSGPILSHMSLESKVVGVILLEEGPMLIASRPILTSSKAGPIGGTFIMGRYLDSSEVDQLAERAGEPVVVRRIDDSQMPPDFAVARSSLSVELPTLVRPLSEEIVAGYALLDDIYGDPVLIVRVDMARDFYRQGQVVMLYLVLSVLAVGVALGAGTLVSLQKLVLTPLTGLSADVNNIANRGDITARVSGRGKDELSSLARAINRMLQSLEQSQRTLEASEAEYRALFENVPHGIYRSTLGGTLLAANPALVRMLGYDSEAEIMAINVARDVYMNPQDRQAWVREMEREGELRDVELVLRRRDGQEVTVLDNAHAVRNKQGAVLYYEGTLTDISERKRMEREISKFGQFLQSVVENANVWLDVLDENANVVMWNKAAELISGYSREEVLGHSKIWEWLYPDEQYRRTITDAVADVVQQGRVEEDIETRIRRKDGQVRIMSWNERSLLDQHGKPIGSIAIGRDVTERKKMQEKLESYSRHLEELVEERTQKLTESERRFRELSDLLPQIVFEIDEKGVVQYMNHAGFAATGVTEEEFSKGLNAFHFLIPAENDRPTGGIQRVMSGEMIGEREFTVLRRDGVSFPALVYAAPITREGKTVGLRGIAVDITQRKRAEEELRAARERLEYVITSNPAVIFTGKPHSDLLDFDNTYMSGSVAALLGYEARDFIADPDLWSKNVHPEDLPRVRAAMPRVFKDGHLSVEYRFMHKEGGYLWIHEEMRVVRDAAGNPLEVIGYWTDMTERKRMEEQILKSERLAAIGETVMMVGHDLRNPLQVLSNSVYLGQEMYSSMPTQCKGLLQEKGMDDLFGTIEKQVDYMNKIVSDLQDYARPVVPELADTSLGQLVADSLSTIRIPNNIRVSFEVEESVPNVMVDRALMMRVFTNLISNAVQAMPSGGELSIAMTQTDGSVSLSFQDTGVGIPEENVSKLFRPLFTTKAKGQGLGLAVCKRLVEAHGGAITAESRVGAGATFTVRIPIVKDVS